METAADSARTSAPAVVAVVVTRNPGPWFDETLAALRAQDYENLAVLVIDAASDVDPTPRIAGVLPDAYVRRLDENPGFGAAVNEVSQIVEGAAFYCILHDDAVPGTRAVSTMVGEALRSNAGVVGAKIVQYDDPRRILQVGESVDKTGERTSTVERGELDQEQHDAVRDVFVVPGAATLVRSDLFAAIGGYDPGIDFLNDDLSLSWRAHLAGARVVVAPDAVIRHVEAMSGRKTASLTRSGESEPSRRERLMRHRIRTMLTCYSRWHRIRVVPQAVVVAVVEVVYSLIVGRAGQAGDVVRAWRWNLARRNEIVARRREIEGYRRVPDAEIRRLQVRGSARVLNYWRSQQRGGTRSDRAQAAMKRGYAGLRDGHLRWPVLAWSVTAVIVALGSRHLIDQPIAAVGGFPPFDAGPGDLFGTYLSGWRDVGLGAEAPAPTVFALLSVAGTLFLGAMGALRMVLLLGSVVAGLVGAYRLVKPTGSPRAQAVALVVYGAIPLAYDAIAEARWGALTVYATMPWIVGRLARITGWAPFTEQAAGRSRPLVRRQQVVGLGLLVALVAAIDPSIIVVVILVVLAITGASVFAGGIEQAPRLLVVVAGALVVSVFLHLPWVFDFVLPGSTWDMVVGPDTSVAYSFAELLRFDVGPVGASALSIGLPLAGLLPLLIGRDWRFEWAVRAWVVALTLLTLTWADGQDWLPFDLPPATTMLAPVAVAFALAAALGVVAFETDLREMGFGWPQIAAALTGVALLVGALPTMFDAGDGRWYLASSGLENSFAFLEEQDPGFRVLWIGDPLVLPAPGYRLGEDLYYATTDDGLPSITDGWPGSGEGATGLIGEALDAARQGETSRLGRILAPMAIRYIVLPRAAAPEPAGGVQRPLPDDLAAGLSSQLDLAQLVVNRAYVAYENEAALATRSTIAPDSQAATSIFDVVAAHIDDGTPVLGEETGRTSFQGPIEEDTTILHSVDSSDSWNLEVDGSSPPRAEAFGWANSFQVDNGGEAELSYETGMSRYLILALQAVFWIVALAVVVRGRAHRREYEDAVGTVDETPVAAGAGSTVGEVRV